MFLNEFLVPEKASAELNTACLKVDATKCANFRTMYVSALLILSLQILIYAFIHRAWPVDHKMHIYLEIFQA